MSSQGAYESCQPSKVPAPCSAAPIISEMFARVFPGSGLFDDPMGLLMQLVAPGPLDVRASLWSLVPGQTTSAICIASCDAGGLLPAARLQEFMPLSHYGFGCVGNKQFKHFEPGACLAAYALSWWACASSRGVDASFASFGLLVPVFRAGGRIGHQITFIGEWRILDCTTLGRADGQSAKWTDAGSADHFSDRARRNLEPMWTKPNWNPSMSPSARSRVAAGIPDMPPSSAKTSAGGTRLHATVHNTNRVSHITPTDIKSSDAQTAQHWIAECKQHLLHE